MENICKSMRKRYSKMKMEKAKWQVGEKMHTVYKQWETAPSYC